MKRLILVVVLGFTTLGFASDSTENQQKDYNLSFQAFGKNMNAYNQFIKSKCYNTSFLDDCFTYMEKLDLVSNNKERFLELVSLLSDPFIENATQFKDSFQPDNKKINYFLRIINQSIMDLSKSLSAIYSNTSNQPYKENLLELNRILIALHGSINDVLVKEQQLRW